jgi:flagellar operon protein
LEVIATLDLVRIPGAGSSGVGGIRDPGQPAGTPSGVGGPSFADELAVARPDVPIRFSRHAQRRLDDRHIDLGQDETDRLRQAFDTLARKGGRQSLVMLDRIAFVVNVPSGTVVTAMAPDEGKEAVFTQIDSVVIA